MARSAHSDVLDQIGRRIANGDLVPATVMTLADLEAEYEASRTVIRETVRVLESIGMVQSRRRVGITVCPTEDWDWFDAHLIRWNLTGPKRKAQLETLMELRIAVEPTAARLAASRASRAQGEELVRLAVEMESLGECLRGRSAEYLADDMAFHTLLLDSSGNRMFNTLAKPVRETLRGRVELGLMPAKPIDASLRGHVYAAQAVLDRDPDAAERCTSDLLKAINEEIAAE